MYNTVIYSYICACIYMHIHAYIHTHIGPFIRCCMLRSRFSWYITCFPAEAQHIKCNLAIVIASSSRDVVSWTPPTRGLWVSSPIPSASRPLRPSSPQPLRPSAPRPDSDHQASLHDQPMGGPMQWEMVMRQGYESTIGYEQVSAWYYHSV